MATESPVPWSAPDPEGGPAPGVEFASPGARLVGYIVDGLIQFGLGIGLAVVSILLIAILAPVGIIVGIIGGIALFLYFPYFWQRSGQTPGMRLMQIKVVRDADGGPLTWGPAILRLIGYWVSGIVFYLGYIWIFIDKRKRGWFDLIAGTVVIKAPADLLS